MSPLYVGDNRKPFVPAPEGLQQCVCVDVVDLGEQETQWGKKLKAEIRWQSEHEYSDDEGVVHRYLIIKRYTQSLNEKAALRKDLETWRGKKFTKEELQKFDLELLVGANCQCQIAHNVTDEATYANVQAVVPMGRGMTKMVPHYQRVKDRKATNGDGHAASVEQSEDLDPLPF